MNFKNSKKGISLYLALIVLSLNLSMVLGLSIILIQEMEVNESLADSAVAFCVAESGLENVLGDDSVDTTAGYYDVYFDLNENGVKDYGDAFATVVVELPSPSCLSASFFCAKSTGRYKEAVRVLSLKR